jgi:hypothetical protein
MGGLPTVESRRDHTVAVIPTTNSVAARRSLWLRWWVPWLLTRAVGILVLAHRISYPTVTNDIRLYGRYSHLWNLGQLPYRDVHVEYPPGILPLLRLPGSTYVEAFLLLAFLADAFALRYLLHDGRRWGGWLWLVAPAALGPLFWTRLDIFVATLLVVGIAAARRERWLIAGLCLGYAGMLKLWPLAIAVGLVLIAPTARRTRTCVGVAIVTIACTLPVILYGGTQGLVWMVHYQAGHGIEIESVAAAPIQLLGFVGHPTPVVYAHATSELTATTLVRVLSGVFDVAFWGSVAGITVWFIRRRRLTADVSPLLLMLVAAMFMTSKILSAQYALWVLAAVAVCIDLVSEKRRKAELAALTLLLFAATQLTYPFAFPSIAEGARPALLVALYHAAVVLGFGAWSIREASQLAAARAPTSIATNSPLDMHANSGNPRADFNDGSLSSPVPKRGTAL